jgi:hypothetical protein
VVRVIPAAVERRYPVPVVSPVLENLLAASLNGGKDVERMLLCKMLLERHLHKEPLPARGNTPEEEQALYDAAHRCAYGTLRLLRQRVENPQRVLVRDLSVKDVEIRASGANPERIFLGSGYPEWHTLRDIMQRLTIADRYFDIPEDITVLRRYFQNVSLE